MKRGGVKCKIILTDEIYALVGEELNIYYDNIINGRDSDYSFHVKCEQGGNYENYFRIVPDRPGRVPIEIKVLQGEKVIAEDRSEIVVADRDTGKDVSKRILIIGDSTTANGIVIDKLNQNFDQDSMEISFIGSCGSGESLHEGRSGWTIDKYYSDLESPFVNKGKFDFQYYMNTNGYKDLDYVFINLGINDVFTVTKESELVSKTREMITQYNEMINSIWEFDKDIKVGICITIPPAYSQDAFGKAYGCQYTRDSYKRNNFYWCERLIERFDNRKEEGIYMIPINLNLDTRYNMGLEEVQVNARNTEVKQTIIANGNIHPAESGYWQIADTYWYFLKCMELL